MKYWITSLLLLTLPSIALADLYRYVDRQGHTHMTGHPLGKGYKLVSRIGTKKPVSQYSKNKSRYSSIINRVAHQFELDPALLHAIIRAESAYNPKALSTKGAVGLMQLMPATAKRFGVSDRWNPKENITGGAKYLKFLLKRYKDNLTLVAASYNAGEGAVDKYGKKVPPYRETRNYVNKVRNFYLKLGGKRYTT